MRLALAYGDRTTDIDVPDDATVLTPPSDAPLPDPAAAIRRSLTQPLDGPPLAQRIEPGDHVAVVLDPALPAALNATLADELLQAVHRCGVPPRQTTLIWSRGLDDALPGRGTLPPISHAGPIVEHDPADPDELIFVRRYAAEHRGGIYLNAAYLRANVRILTGVVAPHYAAGYSGGGTIVLPDLAAAHNTLRHTSIANLLHPLARYAAGPGSPIFDDAQAVARRSGVTFHCALTLNAQDQLSGVFAGGLGPAHDAAIAHTRASAVVPLDQPYDIVLAGAPGARSLAQALPALAAAAGLVREGGTIMLAADCPANTPAHGFGRADYAAIVRPAATIDGVWEALLAPDMHQPGQGLALHHALACRRASVYLYSSLDPADVRRAHFAPTDDLGRTLAELTAAHTLRRGVLPGILALPQGARVVPVLR